MNAVVLWTTNVFFVWNLWFLFWRYKKNSSSKRYEFEAIVPGNRKNHKTFLFLAMLNIFHERTHKRLSCVTDFKNVSRSVRCKTALKIKWRKILAAPFQKWGKNNVVGDFFGHLQQSFFFINFFHFF